LNFRIKTVINVVVVAAAIMLACDHDGSKTEKKDFQSIMAELKAELESALPQEREDPFAIRPFDPFIGSDWIGNAIAYGCYRAGQAPGQKGPSDAELLEDLNIMAEHWNLIRVYGADRDTRRVVSLIDRHDLPLKVVQGIWLAPEENDPEQRKANISQVLLGVELAESYPEIVRALSVGNETQVFWSGHKMKFENVVRYIRAIRKNIAVPVTTADDYLYWNKPESKRLAEEVDFVFTHIHPLWNGKRLDEAVEWTDEVYREIKQMHPDHAVVIGETGWATDYNADKTGPGEQGTLIKGKVGLEAQANFLTRIDPWIEGNRVVTFLFEAFDEPWKGGGESSPPNEIEKNWGVYYEDRTPKESFLEYLDIRHEAQ